VERSKEMSGAGTGVLMGAEMGGEGDILKK
jgi:hypothetical protein